MTLDRFIRVKYKSDDEKIRELVRILSGLGLDCAKTIEEKVDLQFDALKNLHDNLGDNELFIKLVIANSIVSYQLSAKGEQWWWEFSRYFSENPPKGSIADAYAEFLPGSRTNRRLVEGKVRRLEKLEPFLESLGLPALKGYYFWRMAGLRDDLASALNSKRSAKTVVFAVKMFGYAGRIVFGEFVPYPMAIEIPDDVRINAYTKRFTNEPPVSFWGRIAEQTGIPPLHIDSILWPVLGGNGEVLRRLKKHCPEWEDVLKLASL
ncbi:N-glycosylase/DNA lyase [Thermococcus thioreducens]|uniref:N-glycosylase/DNA lyase n=1 Tax=Thermococcus thioreducens TaxID=277988 RepID=A0A0Q2S1W5_9EURY|nr:N-glycosylase/DNA lyase [Thermococcus thioreducens]ASJ12128.1 N-glycosylase [Thermococcus thioreducens]KQH81531.1 N-glycosylase [Thermococcus thioreducens]SEV96463.1 DNA-(apurinic or apyrimidinic site) lyase [Thermococcus thioreducens]